MFPDPQPLVERLGTGFFGGLPRSPGVYLMLDAAREVVYVGKAKDLRQRLSAYRVANPDRMPRRTLRLLHAAREIRIEPCESERAALAREAELLLQLKPRFNRAGVWKGPPKHLGWRADEQTLELAVLDSPTPLWTVTPSLGSGARRLRRRLVRLLWCRLQPDRGLVGMPAGLFAGRGEELVRLPIAERGLMESLLQRLSGLLLDCEFPAFREFLTEPVPAFEKACFMEDLEWLEEWAAGRPSD